MKAVTPDQAKRLALSLGAKLDIGGRTFNSARSQAKPGPRDDTPPSTSAPAPGPAAQPAPQS